MNFDTAYQLPMYHTRVSPTFFVDKIHKVKSLEYIHIVK